MEEKPNIDPEKLAEAVDKMASKAQELGWSRNTSKEEMRAALDNPKFVYVKLGEDQPMDGLILDWGAEKIGFGQITFYPKDGRLICDTETMGADFVKAAMLHFLENSVLYDPKMSPDGG